MRLTVAGRLQKYSRLNSDTGCVEWVGSRNTGGYGHLMVHGKLRTAHRVAFEIAHGPLPEGAHVLHRCDNPSCINPEHLFLGTHCENMADMKTKGRNISFQGERHACARLTEEIVVRIRQDCRRHPEVAADYGVSRSTVAMIRRRKIWKHVA
jgi:hypothetical protein